MDNIIEVLVFIAFPVVLFRFWIWLFKREVKMERADAARRIDEHNAMYQKGGDMVGDS